MNVAALVLGAGRGTRLHRETPKAFVELAGRSLMLRSLAALAACPRIGRIVPVIGPGDSQHWQALGAEPGAIAAVASPVTGGEERQDSVRSGLLSLGPEWDWVAVHDAARPLVRAADVDRVVEGARESGAAILAVPIRDTVKLVRGGRVAETPARAECWAAQTPQVFRTELLREALAKAEAERARVTDDASAVERLGVVVQVVEGDPTNLKITRPEDLAVAEAWLREREGRESS